MLANTSPGAQQSLQAFGKYLAGGFNNDLVSDRLAEVDGQIRLLLLWGDQDRSAPVEIARVARTKLPNSRLAVIAGTNHTPYMECPTLFRQILEAFLHDRLHSFSNPNVTII
jgi:2-hydroxy-6-oxonona-2,4-dienedioate hydrolase